MLPRDSHTDVFILNNHNVFFQVFTLCHSLHHSFHECTDAPLWSHIEQLYVNVKLFVMRLVSGVCNTTKNKASVNIFI